MPKFANKIPQIVKTLNYSILELHTKVQEFYTKGKNLNPYFSDSKTVDLNINFAKLIGLDEVTLRYILKQIAEDKDKKIEYVLRDFFRWSEADIKRVFPKTYDQKINIRFNAIEYYTASKIVNLTKMGIIELNIDEEEFKLTVKFLRNKYNISRAELCNSDCKVFDKMKPLHEIPKLSKMLNDHRQQKGFQFLDDIPVAPVKVPAAALLVDLKSPAEVTPADEKIVPGFPIEKLKSQHVRGVFFCYLELDAIAAALGLLQKNLVKIADFDASQLNMILNKFSEKLALQYLSETNDPSIDIKALSDVVMEMNVHLEKMSAHLAYSLFQPANVDAHSKIPNPAPKSF